MHKWLPILVNAFDSVLLYGRTVKRLLIPVLQIRVRNVKVFLLFLNQNICCVCLNGPIKWDGSFEDYRTHFLNLLIRRHHNFYTMKDCFTWPVWHTKMHFSAKCNSGLIAIHCFHIKHYLDYQYTKFQLYTFRVQKMCVFARYATLVPGLVCPALYHSNTEPSHERPFFSHVGYTFNFLEMLSN